MPISFYLVKAYLMYIFPKEVSDLQGFCSECLIEVAGKERRTPGLL